MWDPLLNFGIIEKNLMQGRWTVHVVPPTPPNKFLYYLRKFCIRASGTQKDVPESVSGRLSYISVQNNRPVNIFQKSLYHVLGNVIIEQLYYTVPIFSW